MINRSQISIALLCLSLFACMQATAMDIDYRLSLRAGMNMPDGKVDATVGKKGQWIGPFAGADFAVSFAPDWQSLRDLNNARIGVALGYWKLDCMSTGANDLLGHAIAPYTFLEIPFYKGPHFEIGVRPGLGCSFITKTYYNTATPEQQGNVLREDNINQAVGSVFNIYLPEAMYFNFPIRDGWVIGLAAGWYHMSNGSIRQPNSGYNLFCGELNVTYRPPVSEEDKAHDGQTPTKEYGLEKLRAAKCEIEMAFSGGARHVYYRDKQTFFCATMQAAAYWRAHRIFRLGGGVDVFYDGSYVDHPTHFKKTYLAGATQADCWRVGLSIQPDFVFGRFSAGFGIGFYLHDPVKNREVSDKDTEAYNALWEEGIMPNKGIFYPYEIINKGRAGDPDGWLYTTINLRYRLPYHLMVHAMMKAHITNVEYVAAGIGVYL